MGPRQISGRRRPSERIKSIARRTLRLRKLVTQTVIACAGSVVLAGSVHAADLSGVWITDASACSKVFAINGNNVSFRPDADMFGSGFIIDGSRMRGRMATCNVTKTQEKEGVIHMIASCATDIMLQTVQFSLKVVDENRITRIFPGVDGMELTYYRCPTNPAAAQ